MSLQPDWDVTMPLSIDETNMSLQIKGAVEQRRREFREDNDDHEAQLKELSDFDYVQYALSTEDESMEMVLERITMMQAFKEEYNIHDTPEEGSEILLKFMLQHPGVLMAVPRCYFSVEDWTAFDHTVIQTVEQQRIFMAFHYYNAHCKLSHFQAMRQGTSTLIELGASGGDCCDPRPLDVDDLAAQLGDRVLHQFVRCYPEKRRDIFLQNPPHEALLALGLRKRYLCANVRNSIHVGLNIAGFQGQRIDVVYQKLPEDVARRNLMALRNDLLTVRYRNQREFALPTHYLAGGTWG